MKSFFYAARRFAAARFGKKVPWHGTVIVGTLLSDDGTPIASDGWHAENIKIHIY